MKAYLLASAFLALLAPQKGVQVNANVKNGETIVGERRIRVTVTSNNPVREVEFYAGKDLRDKDTSTPYEFVVDSLAENDGNLPLRFVARTTEGEVGEAKITVKIDNGVSKGAAFHIDAGEKALQESKWDDAVTAGRIALKADPQSTVARMILARAYFMKGDTAKAQKNAEDVLESKPNDAAALDLLSAINLKAAFSTYISEGGNRKDALESMRGAFKTAVESRRKVLDETVDAQPTTNVNAYADTAFRAGRYNLPIPALRTAVEKDNRDGAVANRLAYAYLRQGRYTEAVNVLNTLQKNGGMDAFSFAAMAVAKAEAGDIKGSDDAIREALVSDPEDLSVIAAQAHIALKFVRNPLANMFQLNYDDLSGGEAAAKIASRETLRKLVNQLEQAAGARTETQYYKEALYNKLSEYAKAQTAFERAVLAEPANYDAFIEAGNRLLASTQLQNMDAQAKEQALSTAAIMFDTALIARPDSSQALTGMALVSTINGKMEQAIKFADAAVRANPEYAAAQVALGTAFQLASVNLRKQADAIREKSRKAGTTAAEKAEMESQARQIEDQSNAYGRQSRDAGLAAAKADKRTEGQELSKPYAAWRYYSAGGRTPVLPQPK
jgi:tetratricopeptide (TPR) repeat protein